MAWIINIFTAFCANRRGFRWVVKGGRRAVFNLLAPEFGI